MKHFPLFFLVLIFAGCALPAESTPVSITPTPTRSVTSTVAIFSFKIASGGGETWAALGDEISDSIPVSDIKIEAVQTDSVMENLKLLTSGKVEMALGYDYHVVLANEGRPGLS